MPIKVLIINDSATARAALRAAMADEDDIAVVAELASGAKAVAAVETMAPDVVLMDIVMPDADGYAVTRDILRSRRIPILMISARVTPGDVVVALDALRAGAIAVLEAPPPPTDAKYDVRRRAIIHTIRSAAALPRHPFERASSSDAASTPGANSDRTLDLPKRTFAVAAIVASLGGPPVVAELLGQLSPKHPPIFLVQHIEASFVEGFVVWLRGATKTNVQIAVNGMELERGAVYVAPGEHHLGVGVDRRVALSTAPAVGGFRPSGNHLLTMVARAYGPQALGIILTGMGRDGAEGALALKTARGFVIAQDAASCTVASMPNAAVARGAVDLTLTPGAIAAHIR